jgi:carbonic anhydrase/acetyltransferase-like protein (isoleucine patch superfamily)
MRDEMSTKESHSGERDLTRSLTRARTALARTGSSAGGETVRGKSAAGPVAAQLGVGALVLFVLAFALGQPWLLWLALAAAAGGTIALASGPARGFLGGLAGYGSPERAQVGMGATVASDAVLDPGARIEMGADVGTRAVVRGGAVVRMGASVGEDAVLERRAIVSWGASVHKGAVVEEGAIVGAGSDVLAGARVPAGMWVRPGSTFGAGSTSTATASLPAAPARAAESDPRQARVAEVCGKLESELRAAPELVRDFLGGSAETVASLRATCEDLARRERELRAEASPAALQRLEEERAALEKRIAQQQDEQIRLSLSGALAAIDDQKRQRELLRLAADRLDAEHTRLLYSLEGLASQFVRARTAGAQGRDPAGLEQSVRQLRQELDAIADALEEVSRTTPSGSTAMRELAEAPASAEGGSGRSRARTRE